jgi:hypothetical protein
VPLAVALLSISNPTVSTMDMLSRLSHDNDQEVAQNAVLALGAIMSETLLLFASELAVPAVGITSAATNLTLQTSHLLAQDLPHP